MNGISSSQGITISSSGIATVVSGGVNLAYVQELNFKS